VLNFLFLAFREIEGEIKVNEYQSKRRKQPNDVSHLEEASAVLSPR
jgi:hypothetical protein